MMSRPVSYWSCLPLKVCLGLLVSNMARFYMQHTGLNIEAPVGTDNGNRQFYCP